MTRFLCPSSLCQACKTHLSCEALASSSCLAGGPACCAFTAAEGTAAAGDRGDHTCLKARERTQFSWPVSLRAGVNWPPGGRTCRCTRVSVPPVASSSLWA